MKFKTNTLTVLFATILSTGATSVLAADTSTLEFDLEANIPAARYYVKFNTPTFPDTPQKMAWDHITETLGNVSTDLKVKNTAGNITAHLINDAQLVNTADQLKVIPLEVKIGAETLSVGAPGAVEILPASEMNEVMRTLVVSPQSSPTPAYDSGDYIGTVSMMFDYDI